MVNWSLPRNPAIVQAFGIDFRAYFMRVQIVSLVAVRVDWTFGNNQSLLDSSVMVQVIGQAVESCYEVTSVVVFFCSSWTISENGSLKQGVCHTKSEIQPRIILFNTEMTDSSFYLQGLMSTLQLSPSSAYFECTRSGTQNWSAPWLYPPDIRD